MTIGSKGNNKQTLRRNDVYDDGIISIETGELCCIYTGAENSFCCPVTTRVTSLYVNLGFAIASGFISIFGLQFLACIFG
jgi:hypothetical protein